MEVLTTEPFRAAVQHCAPLGREGVFASIVHLREVFANNLLITDRLRRAVHDVRFADRVGQLNQVGLGLPYEDRSIRQIVEIDPAWWQDARSRGKRGMPGVQTVLQIFFTEPEEYVDGAGKFLPDLAAKSREFKYGRVGGFVFDRFVTAGDQSHRKPGSRRRRWQDEVRR